MRLTACVLALAACSGSSTDGAATDSQDTTGGDGSFAPSAGDWAYVQKEVVSDDCGVVDEIGLDSGTFAIASSGAGAFTVDDGTYVFDCTLSGQDFTCPDRFGGEGTMTMMGATILLSGEAHGTFSDASAASGGQSGDADCEDGDAMCEQGAQMMFGQPPPCHVEVTYDISL